MSDYTFDMQNFTVTIKFNTFKFKIMLKQTLRDLRKYDIVHIQL